MARRRGGFISYHLNFLSEFFLIFTMGPFLLPWDPMLQDFGCFYGLFSLRNCQVMRPIISDISYSFILNAGNNPKTETFNSLTSSLWKLSVCGDDKLGQ